MSKYRVSTLSPIHISSGNEYENNFNMLYKNGFVYIYDEFKIVEFFINKNIEIPTNLDTLKKNIKRFKDEIISSNLHIRKIENSFSDINKPLLEQMSSSSNPIIAGSSLKGSFRTAIIECLNSQDYSKCNAIYSKLKNKKFSLDRFQNRGRNIENFDKDFANIFKHLSISDSFEKLETKIYKTINVKKAKEHQEYREEKVKKLTNLVECIKPNQTFEIFISDKSFQQFGDNIFSNLGSICNIFYLPWYNDEIKNYFNAKRISRINMEKIRKGIHNKRFFVNIGRFSGAERKSINNLRYIKNSKADDKNITSARTYALEKETEDNVFFEKALLPFGWLLFEKIE